MDREPNNSAPPAGTDNAQPSTDVDNPSNWDFEDLEETQDTQEAPGAKGTEGETDEAAAGDQEAEGESAENEADPEAKSDEDEPKEEAKDDVLVTLSDGAQVKLDELKQGYLRQSDYTRKAQEVASDKIALKAKADRIDNTIGVFTGWLAQQLPKEPDIGLSVTNPNEYVAQKAQYEAALAQVRHLAQLGAQAKGTKQELSDDQVSEISKREFAALAAALPVAKTEKGRKELADTFQNVGRELGYSEAEISAAQDHRLVVLAHWAKKGMDAEKARAKAQMKVQNVPPVAPQRRAGNGAGGQVQNREAMRRLAKSGSFADAMQVDFD